MANDAEHLLMPGWPPGGLLSRNVYSLPLPLFNPAIGLFSIEL